MAAVTYLFLYYVIPLLCGQLSAVLPSNATQHTTAPFMKANQSSSNVHLQPSLMHSEVKSSIQTFVGQTISLKLNQTVLNTKGNQRDNFSSTGAVPLPSLQSYSGVRQQLTSDMITGHLLTATTTQQITSTTAGISQYLIVITSSSSNVLQNNNHSTPIFVSPMLETPISSSSSISKEMPVLTSSPNGLLIPTVSKVNIMSTSSNVKLRSSYLPSSTSFKMRPNQTSSTFFVPNLSSSNVKLRSSYVLPSPTSSKMRPNQTSSTSLVSDLSSSNVKLRSSYVLLSPTSSEMKPNQTSSTFFVSNVSSSNVKLNLNSSTMVPPPSSVQNNSYISSTHSVISVPVITVEPSSPSQVMRTATSTALNSTHFVKSIMSSPPWSKQSVTSTVFQISSFTVTTEASCNNSLICIITLQPSATTVQYYTSMSNENSLSSSISNNQRRNSSIFMPSSVSGINSSSILYPEKTTQGPVHGNKEETHTTLIIGLAVGLSLSMVVIILIVVYYRRKRSSYQYNVFYDEQNIVMHPFDYSK